MAKTSLVLGTFSASSIFSPNSVSGQSVQTVGYAKITGTCTSIVKSFEVSANLITGGSSTWFPVSSTELPTGTETDPATNGLVFDQDCSDGVFSVYVFNHNLINWFTVGTTSGDNNVLKFLIRAVLADGTKTDGIVIYDGSSSGSGPPVKADLRKLTSPMNLIQQSLCTPLEIILYDSNGRESASIADVTVSVYQTVSGTSSLATIDIFSDGGCQQPLATGLTSVLANNSRRTIYLRTAAAVNSVVTYFAQLNSVNSTPLSLKIKTASDQFLTYDGPWQVVSGACYPMKLTLNDFSGWMSAAANITIPISGLNAFSTVNCATGSELTTLTINSGNSTITFYATITAASSSIDWVVTPSPNTIEGFSQNISISTGTSTVIAKARVNWGPNNLNFLDCQMAEIMLFNSQDVPLPNNTASAISLTLFSDISNTSNTAGIYSDSLCSAGNRLSSLVFSPSEFRKQIYVMALAPSNFNIGFSNAGLGISSVPFSVSVNGNIKIAAGENLFGSGFFPTPTGVPTFSFVSANTTGPISTIFSSAYQMSWFDSNFMNLFDGASSGTFQVQKSAGTVTQLNFSYTAVPPAIDLDFLDNPATMTAGDPISEATLKWSAAFKAFNGSQSAAFSFGGSYLDRNGQLAFATSMAIPRFEYDQASCIGAAFPMVCSKLKGLLVEENRTNLVAYTNNIATVGASNPFTTVTNLSVTSASSMAAPTGNLNEAALVTKSNGAVTSDMQTVFTSTQIPSGQDFIYSIFVKTTSAINSVGLYFGTGGGDCISARYTLVGAVGNVFMDNSQCTSTLTSVAGNAGIEAYPNSWYRIWIRGNFSAPSTSRILKITPVVNGSGTNLFLVGDDYFYGPQLEAGSFMTSFIKNQTGSPMNRTSNDWISLTNSSVLNTNGTSLVIEANPLATDVLSQSTLLDLESGASSSNLMFGYDISGSLIYLKNSSGNPYNLSGVPLAVGVPDHRSFIAFDSQMFFYGTDGTLVNAGSNPVGNFNKIMIGQSLDPFYLNRPFSGHIQKIRIWNERLSQPALNSLSRPR